MADRLDLKLILEGILESNAVYFQSPPTIQMVYPCIVYHRSDIDTKFADNVPYGLKKEYTITVIDKDPDSLIPDRVSLLESCTFDRRYIKDNLYHDVFSLYF